MNSLVVMSSLSSQSSPLEEKKHETFPEKDMVTRFITSIFSSIEKNVHITIVLLICLFIARDQYRRSTVICGVEYKLIF